MKLVVSSISFKYSTDQTNIKLIINLLLRLIFQLLLLRQLKFFHFFLHVCEAPVKLVLQIVFQGSFIIIHDLSYENQVLDLYLLIIYQTIKRVGIFQNFTFFLIIPPNLALAVFQKFQYTTSTHYHIQSTLNIILFYRRSHYFVVQTSLHHCFPVPILMCISYSASHLCIFELLGNLHRPIC